MKSFKNIAIVVLTALLGLSLLTQPAQSAGKSKEAKTVEYTRCLEVVADSLFDLDVAIAQCAKYRP